MKPLVIKKMDMSDVPFVYAQEMDGFGKSLSEKTLYNEVLYNDLAYYYIAQKADVRVGYIGLWITVPNAEITNFSVIASERRQGVGTALIHHAINRCKDHHVESLTLEVRASNIAAQAFYETLGFKRASIRKAYYTNGEDACLMMKKIGG